MIHYGPPIHLLYLVRYLHIDADCNKTTTVFVHVRIKNKKKSYLKPYIIRLVTVFIQFTWNNQTAYVNDVLKRQKQRTLFDNIYDSSAISTAFMAIIFFRFFSRENEQQTLTA